MAESITDYRELLELYLNNQCTPVQAEALIEFLISNESSRILLEQWQGGFTDHINQASKLPQETAERLRQQLLDRIDLTSRTVPFYRRSLFRTAVAAIIILLLGSGVYYTFFIKRNHSTEFVKTPELSNDVRAPETSSAMITLSNGREIHLNNASNGILASERNVKLIKLADGQIAYIGNPTLSGIVYNTLSNPRGSKATLLTLNDSTKVWLNAASSIKYYTSIDSCVDRQVELTGEAYFEVARFADKKFLVNTNGTTVEVLGTHFNIRSYSDENSIKITLLEGSVKVSKGSSSVLLTPGQQAEVSEQIKVSDNVGIESAISWKVGLFRFDNADISTIIRELARWYNVNVSFEGDLPRTTYSCILSRYVNLSDVLKVLTETGGVSLKLRGKTIIVRSK